MKTLDRYIVRLFLTNLAIIFVVVALLYVVGDLIVQFDEFVQAAEVQEGGAGEQTASTIALALDYYWPNVFLIYNYMIGLLPIAAAGFTFASLLRNKEITAMLAGGISMYRIAMPIFAATFVLNIALVANQEFIIPGLAKKLVRKPTDLRHEGQTKKIALRFVPDGNGALLSCGEWDSSRALMRRVAILQRERVTHDDGSTEWGRASQRIVAEMAQWNPEKKIWELGGGEVVYRGMGSDNPDLATQRRSLEVWNSDLTPDTITLRERSRYRFLLSLTQLSDLIGRAGQSQAMDIEELLRIRHSRFSVLVLNMLILAIGLPFFLLRAPANLFLQVARATAACVGVWAGGLIMLQMGSDLMPPAAVAWLPVVINLPFAYWRMDTIKT